MSLTVSMTPRTCSIKHMIKLKCCHPEFNAFYITLSCVKTPIASRQIDLNKVKKICWKQRKVVAYERSPLATGNGSVAGAAEGLPVDCILP